MSFYSCPALHPSMAVFTRNLLPFIITLSFSLQIHAKDSQFTNNVYHELDQNSPIKNLIPNSKYLPKAREQNSMTENGNAYGFEKFPNNKHLPKVFLEPRVYPVSLPWKGRDKVCIHSPPHPPRPHWVTNFIEPSGNNDYYYNNNNQLQDLSEPRLMDKGYSTTSASTTNSINTKDCPYKNGGKSDNINNRYMLSEEHVNFRGYHGNEDDYNDETEPHMP